MKQITLAKSTTRKLEKESQANRELYRVLCRESIARNWLKLNGIPSWRNPVTPVINVESGSAGRPGYSIMLADGSRFLVCPYPSALLFLDALASARCFAALSVKLSMDCTYGSVNGAVFLRDIPRGKKQYCFAKGGLESGSTFLHYLGVHSGYRLKLICFTARLILFGEPDAPGRGIEGVKAFSPFKRG